MGLGEPDPLESGSLRPNACQVDPVQSPSSVTERFVSTGMRSWYVPMFRTSTRKVVRFSPFRGWAWALLLGSTALWSPHSRVSSSNQSLKHHVMSSAVVTRSG